MKKLLIALVLVVMCGRSHAAWTTYQSDAAHTGRANTSFDVEDLKLQWQVQGAGDVLPVIRSNSLIVKAGAALTSYRLNDGQVQWRVAAPTNGSPVSVADGKVVYLAKPLNAPPTMYVHSANSGEMLYSFPLTGHPNSGLTPTLHKDGKTLVAYVASGDGVSAIRIGRTNAELLWNVQQSLIGGQSHATVVEDSVVVNGSGQYFAIDRFTGEINHFHQGNIVGGGGTTASYDATRRQFYIAGSFNVGQRGLTAYRYNSHDSIEMLWQRQGIDDGVALGEDGKVYAPTYGGIDELDPETGKWIRSFRLGPSEPYTTLASVVTPVVSDHHVWAFTPVSTIAFDLQTGQLVRRISESIGNYNTAYSSAVVADGRYLVTRTTSSLRVYAPPIPEPASGMIVFTFAVLWHLPWNRSRHSELG